MNILHLRSTNFYGGPERQLLQHARLLGGTEYCVTIASFTENGQAPDLLQRGRKAQVNTALFAVSGAYDRSAPQKVRDYLSRHEIDLLCTHDYRSHLIGHLACRKVAARHICFARGFTRDDWKVRLYQMVDRATLRWADYVVAVSQAEEAALSRWGVRADKVSVVYNSVDPVEFEDVPVVDLGEYHQLPDNRFTVIAGGRFSREKGQDFLVQAARDTIERNDRAYFLLYGDGPDRTRIQQTIDNLGLSDRVLCPGFEKNLMGCLKGADLVVNPSMSEGLPNIVLEAMAVGTPVVATAVGGVPELIESGKHGLLVTYGDAEGLVAALMTMIEQNHTRKNFAVAGRKRVEEAFTFESQATNLMAVYEKVLR